MGRFHKTYQVSGRLDECKKQIERYLLSRGYEETEEYYGRRMFTAQSSAGITVLGADNNLRFLDVDTQEDRLVIEAWILNAYATRGDKSWHNPNFVTRLDKNEIDPSVEGGRCKSLKKDLLLILEDIGAIVEEYNQNGMVEGNYVLPSGQKYDISTGETLAQYLKGCAPESFRRAIAWEAAFLYVMAVLAVVAAVMTSTWSDLVQIGLVVLLAVFIHVRKSKLCANALFALCVAGVLLPFLFGSSSNWVTWLLLMDAYLMVNTFGNAQRMYRRSLEA